LKPKLVYIIFKNSARTAKETPHFTITKINWLTLFKEIIAVYSENHTRPTNTKFSIADCFCRWYISQMVPFGFKESSSAGNSNSPVSGYKGPLNIEVTLPGALTWWTEIITAYFYKSQA
jgi:hypothetical protein